MHTQYKMWLNAYADPEAGAGCPNPLKYHKNMEYYSNTGPGPLKNHKKAKKKKKKKDVSKLDPMW